jgi:deoxyribodipyrimidine photo-lyase
VGRTTVCWFRRDLRLADNHAWTDAAARGPVVPVFVVDPALVRRAGGPRLAYLSACLDALDRSLDGHLVLRVGAPADVLAALAAETGAGAVVHAADTNPYARRRDAAVAARLASLDVEVQVRDSPYAIAPGTVARSGGQPYRVFSAFLRSWLGTGWQGPLPEPKCDLVDGLVSDPWSPPSPATDAHIPAAGEVAAHAALDAFMAGPAHRYADDRDLVDLDATSHLSPHLRWGVLHPRQILAFLDASPGHTKFRAELCWREFLADVLARDPRAAWHNIDASMNTMSVDADAGARERFLCWCEARTGFPFVDAGMRQLVATGWMPNRVRMVTASFLVKDLHLPWQWGARHFLDHLVDGDLASNNLNWQWVAGTGIDAAPYFRIFNPTAQSRRFDPSGDYIRRYLPELAGTPSAQIHEPSGSSRGLPRGYPPPIVDHAAERAEALQRYRTRQRG